MTETVERTTFTDLGFNDILIGTELFTKLRISEGDLMSPAISLQLQEIADFLNHDVDPIFTINTVSRSNKDPKRSDLEHFSSFVQLNKNKNNLKQSLEEVERQLEFYG